MDFKGKKILVVGLGVSGFSASRLLSGKGARVFVSESEDSDIIRERREVLSGEGIEVETGGHTRSFCSGHEIAVLSPGISIDHFRSLALTEPDTRIIGELELGCMFLKNTVIAITGTNGKTTTSSLLGEIFSLAGKRNVVCGNIGNPLTGELERISSGCVVILEVSSFQLESMTFFRPYVAALLNISEDHYQRHGGLTAYKQQKYRIFLNQSEQDWSILRSDLAADCRGRGLKGKIRFFGSEGARFRVRGNAVVLSGGKAEQVVVSESESALKGRHNMENISCCFQIAEIFDISFDIVRTAVKNFQIPDHRFQYLGTAAGVFFIDDSKATNIDSTKRALESLDRKVVLIAGGRDKLGDYTVLKDIVRDRVSVMVVMGEAANKIKNIFSNTVMVHEAKDMPDAVRMAVNSAGRGGAVLLSPMCSSFDMFRDYKHRGMEFRSAVEEVCGPFTYREDHEK